MHILKKSEQAFVPVNQPQPGYFPRFYIIAETKLLQTLHPASNDPRHHQAQPTRIKCPPESAFRKYARQEKEIFQEVCADAWAAIKQAGRDTVQWLAWWVVLPLAISSSLYVPAIHPMNLPL